MILVTGAGGHLGANLLRRLVADGHRVRALVRTTRDQPSLSGLPVETLVGDLRDPALANSAVRGINRVFHCAAKVSTSYRNSEELFECNVLATRNLLQAAQRAGVAKLVATGSFGAVGSHGDDASHEDHPFDPLGLHTPYARTKAAMEHECLKAFADGLPVVIAVSTAILGPYDFKPSRMGQVLIRFAHGRLRAYVPGGVAFVAARDIVEGHVLAMEKGRPGQKYIFASEFMTFDRLMGLFSRVTGRPVPGRLPQALMSAVSEVVERVMPYVRPDAEQLLSPAAIRILRSHRRADISKAKSELGFQPTSVEAAVHESYQWFVASGAIKRPLAATRISAEMPT